MPYGEIRLQPQTFKSSPLPWPTPCQCDAFALLSSDKLAGRLRLRTSIAELLLKTLRGIFSKLSPLPSFPRMFLELLLLPFLVRRNGLIKIPNTWHLVQQKYLLVRVPVVHYYPTASRYTSKYTRYVLHLQHTAAQQCLQPHSKHLWTEVRLNALFFTGARKPGHAAAVAAAAAAAAVLLSMHQYVRIPGTSIKYLVASTDGR